MCCNAVLESVLVANDRPVGVLRNRGVTDGEVDDLLIRKIVQRFVRALLNCHVLPNRAFIRGRSP
jgi:hypothetical protein